LKSLGLFHPFHHEILGILTQGFHPFILEDSSLFYFGVLEGSSPFHFGGLFTLLCWMSECIRTYTSSRLTLLSASDGEIAINVYSLASSGFLNWSWDSLDWWSWKTIFESGDRKPTVGSNLFSLDWWSWKTILEHGDRKPTVLLYYICN